MRERKLLWHEDLSRGSVSHKDTPTFTLLKHSQRVLLLGNQVSSKDTKSTITLISGSTKELLHQGRGSPRPPAQSLSTPFHTKPEGRWRCRRVTRLQGWPAHRVQVMVHSRTTAQGTQSCLLTHLGTILALSLTKDVLNLKMWSIWSLVGLEMFLDVCGSSLNSSNSKMAGRTHIYSPPSWTSRLEPLILFLRRASDNPTCSLSRASDHPTPLRFPW